MISWPDKITHYLSKYEENKQLSEPSIGLNNVKTYQKKNYVKKA